MKQKTYDFLCAVVITMGVLICFALVSGTEFFDDAVSYDNTENTLEIFGTSFEINQKALLAAEKVLGFNDCIFGEGFAERLKYAAKEGVEFIGDGMGIAFGLAKRIVGAE